MAAQTWNSLQQTILIGLAQAPSPYNVIPADFAALFPQATSYAEQRINEDLVLLANREQDVSLTVSAGVRSLSLSGLSQVCLAPEGFALLTPAGATLANGIQQPFEEASLDFIDQVWPQQSETLAPDAALWIGRWWALLDDHTIIMAPTPDAAYPAVVTGLFQSVPISNANQSTYISTVYPALLEEAVMIWMSGWLQRNYGASADDPKMAQSHEAQYQTLKVLAQAEESRRRGLRPDHLISPPQAPR